MKGIKTAKENNTGMLDSPYDNIEIHSCRVLDKKGNPTSYEDGLDFEQCEPEDKVCDTVYFHLKTGGIQWFADFRTRAEARRFAAELGKLMGFAVDEF